ncbi:MAG: nucleotidyltransferase family protein, partial [Sideroxyarcus sp.]|nr:nucleotidyltransferase family protein [Sideroxyarcus sp.]
GISLDESIQRIMNHDPTVATIDEGREVILAAMQRKVLHHIPLVDKNHRVVGLETLDELIQLRVRENRVVLMAGGLGSRLSPLTDECPKPMLKVGNKPLLETILENFIEYGFHRFYISVNYMANVVKSYFGDGSRWGVDICYLHEDQRLGTAGALSLLPVKPKEALFVMNGDLLTKVNFKQLLDFHSGHHAQATMCVREYDFQVPYGVVKIDAHRITSIDEKPIQRFFVNAGIYVLEPEALDLISSNTYFDMPTLFEKLIALKKETAVFPIREYWLDVGQLADYERANGEYRDFFS